MSAKILVIYHARIFGGEPAVAEGHAIDIMVEQMTSFARCGLLPLCSQFVMGLNGDERDRWALEMIKPYKAELVLHGTAANSELPTLHWLQGWLADPGHGDWYVLYFHLKGARHGTNDALTMAWRRCMEGVVLTHWQRCVRALDEGYETAGAHWLTNAQYGSIVKRAFWGGNFWWAKAEFLRSLPALPANRSCREDDFLAETWIGDGPRLPKALDLRPHWPNLPACSAPML